MTRAIEIRIRGRVQGVGFRPTVWRFARQLKLKGEVLNDAEGVLVRVGGKESDIATLIERIEREPPPLAKIEAIEKSPFAGALPVEFHIAESAGGSAQTEITPDAAICDDCAYEIDDPSDRRFRYPFTNCTNCGPRLTIIGGVPYDRARTAMAQFLLCQDCAAEYHAPSDRRFHAEAIACHSCGPKVSLVRFDGEAVNIEQQGLLDDIDAAGSLIQKGEIVAIKGLGGYHLACDATNAEAVTRLRVRKQRDSKPFALMARDLDVVRAYCTVSAEEEQWLTSPTAPIVILRAHGLNRLPEAVAPGLSTFAFMLPTTPLHLLVLQHLRGPVVMTSGNLSEEPQVIGDVEACQKLSIITPYALLHNRAIFNRVDDSVVRQMGQSVRVLRRARGYAPAPIRLPEDFIGVPEVLAMGGELKAAFCLVKNGEAILSQHQGDLENADTFDDYQRALTLYAKLYNHKPMAFVADCHPEYISAKLAFELAESKGSPVIQVQHHHAHVASCLAENGRALSAPPVLGIVLDGLGFGDNGAFWGGEFMIADYCDYRRLGTFKPVAMPGGAQAAREPWRNLYAHLMAEMGWGEFEINFSGLELYKYLKEKPRGLLDSMIRGGVNAPLASSCGRLFDAVAAALNISPNHQSYEGEAAAMLEAITDEAALAGSGEDSAYPFAIPNLSGKGLPYIEPLGMWRALLGDLILNTPPAIIAARFHKGVANAIVAMVKKLTQRRMQNDGMLDTIALSGGCFQNRILFELVARRLEAENFIVLSHALVPANDGGIALGQAAIATAQLLRTRRSPLQGNLPCASEFQAESSA